MTARPWGSPRQPELFALSDNELTDDAALSHLTGAILLSAVLSISVAFTDALALGGLAVKLTSGLSDDEATLLGARVTVSFPVIIALVATTLALNFLNTLVRERTTTGWDAARRKDLVSSFRRADFPEQASYSGAGLSAAIEQIGKASASIGAIVGLINTVGRTTVYVGIAVAISWQVSVVVVIAGGLLMTGLRQVSRRTRVMHKEMAQRYIFVGEEIGEMAVSARELHALNRWEETERFLGSEISTIQRLRYISATMAGMVGPIYWAGTLLVGVAVAASASGSSATTSGIAASGLLLIRSLQSAQNAQTMYQTYHDARPYVDRVRSVLADLRRAERTASIDAVPPGLTLSIDGADFTYGRDVVVPNLDLEMKGPGGIAIVGPSGSGKSTTLRALSGMARPARGSIRMNGVALDSLTGEELGAIIGLLPQDPKLLRGSLRSNLLRPDVDRTDDQLWSAITAVGLEETVRGFEGHMDEPVGRAAEGFSGGELQRLGLARLIVNHPDVWLVDEPTSALDRANSKRVLDLLGSAMDDQLVVVVTHRPELLHSCKRVIYMDGGSVVDDGTLEAISRRQPFVASMIAAPDSAAPGSGSSAPEERTA